MINTAEKQRFAPNLRRIITVYTPNP